MTDSRQPAPEFDLTGRVAVVTGASRGIGRAIALAYARHGAKVVLTSRKQPALDQVAEEVGAAGGEALPIACHTGDVEAIGALFERVEGEWGGVDVLVNNAATNPHFGPILTADDSHWDQTFEVNVKGYVHMARAVVPAMRRRGGGAIVNVASIAGSVPHHGLGVYSVSKAAVLMLTKVLAAELAGDAIRVNAIAPGLIETRFSQALIEDPQISRRALRSIPLGRFGQPGELTGMAVYLASPAAAFTTGAVMYVDGGQSLGSGG